MGIITDLAFINNNKPIVERMKLQKPTPKPQKSSQISKPPKKKQLTLQQILKKDKNFTLTPSGKLLCKLTNHQMPATPSSYYSYLETKSYKRGLESQFDISDYELILVDFKGDPKYYYCQLTGAKVAKKKSVVEKHLKGKRFQRLFEELKKREEEELALGEVANGDGGDEQQVIQDQQEEEQQEKEQQPTPQKKPAKKHTNKPIKKAKHK